MASVCFGSKLASYNSVRVIWRRWEHVGFMEYMWKCAFKYLCICWYNLL